MRVNDTHLKNRAGFFAFGDNPYRALKDLAPELVYASTDIMDTGNAIVQVVGSNGTTADMTESELYGSTYSNFVSTNGTTKIAKIYNQGSARGLTPNRDLSQDVSSNQPVVDVANKRFIFDDAFVYSPELTISGQGSPNLGSSMFFASKIFAPDHDSNDADQGKAPLLSMYNGESGGPGLNFGFSHTMHHRQITYYRTSTNAVISSSDSGGTPSGYYPQTNTQETSDLIANNGDTEFTIFGRHISRYTRGIQVLPEDAVYNNTDSGAFTLVSSSDVVRWGIGGYKTQSTTKDIPTSFSLKVSMVFNTTSHTGGVLPSADITDLTRILGDL